MYCTSRGVMSDMNSSRLTPVACSTFATDSVDGQRRRPSGETRFDLLNVVGSSPAFLASPEALESVAGRKRVDCIPDLRM